MQARVKWVEGLTFLGESASGHQVLMDGNSGDKAPSPMEMLLMSAGGVAPLMSCLFYKKGVTMCGIARLN
ncbi:protein yhfA [Yersinia pestis 1670]|nr:protein yhfA [Yersinia pestis 1670]